jgi:hypothetical protein
MSLRATVGLGHANEWEAHRVGSYTGILTFGKRSAELVHLQGAQ